MSDVPQFDVKFREAIAYLKGKLPEGTMAWNDIAGPVHGKVFTVAGATNLDLVKDLHGAINSAIENGTTLAQFRKDFDQIVQRHGWTYNGSRGWRTRVIFDNNMRSARMAGRWAQLQANKNRRPYLQYRTAGDARVRLQHRMWDGIVRHIDDPFWDTHYPPNGWGCRCTIRPYGQAELDTLGLKVQTAPAQIKMRQVVNADGQVTDEVPLGIDPGWDHNVGKAWIQPEIALGKKLATLPPELRGSMVDKTITPAFQSVLNDRWKAFREGVNATSTVKQVGDMVKKSVKATGQAHIVGFLDSATMDSIASKVPDLQLESTTIGVFDKKITHLEGHHKAGQDSAPQQVWPSDWIDDLPSVMRNYRAVLWDKQSESLVFVPQGAFNKSIPRIAVRPNMKTKWGTALSVVSLGSARLSNLTDANKFELLLGSLKE